MRSFFDTRLRRPPISDQPHLAAECDRPAFDVGQRLKGGRELIDDAVMPRDGLCSFDARGMDEIEGRSL